IMYDVPHLRFPEFSGEWERKRLKDVCNIRTGNKNTQDKSDNGIYPFYVRSQIVERINSWTFDGEAILTAGDGVGVGKVFHYSTGKIGVHQRVYILSDFKCDGKYLYSYFAGNFYNRVKRMSAKNSVDSVRMEMIADMPIALPSIEEQKKIGHLLALLDDRIATQNKIIEKLQSLIKGIVDELMTVLLKGELYPFASLYIKAGEGGTPTTSVSKYYSGGSIPFIKIDDLSQKYLTSNKDFITELGMQKSSAWLIPSQSVIYSNGATIGAISINKYPVCTKQGILGIVPNINVNVEYLYLLMSSSYFSKEVGRIITEGTMKTAYLKDINHIKSPLPSKAQQQNITNLTSSIEKKLSMEQNCLKFLKLQKQHLLRTMFI
ncbi:restriction endonuclease subunit S, partial [uncultured Phocaeicola sp.]|uniref:restriction endonuclease subunit S n=7 Tax=uncultured Phocaeicola sp. TaxID=990718 RepID=UPI00338DC778